MERTLLTTGALAFQFESRARRARVATPELAIRYRAPRKLLLREVMKILMWMLMGWPRDRPRRSR